MRTPANSSSDSTHRPVSTLAAERAQVRDERVRQALRSAPRDGPADAVGAQREHDPERGAGRARRSESIECAQHPARSARARSPSKRDRASAAADRRALRAEPRQHERMPRRAQRAEDLLEQLVGPGEQRVEQAAVRVGVRSQTARRLGRRTARASPPSRRRADERAAPPGGRARARARASGSELRNGDASGQRSAPWSRCRARTRAASAPRSGTRRPPCPSLR